MQAAPLQLPCRLAVNEFAFDRAMDSSNTKVLGE
jgi:hypothetical protein